MTRPRNLLEVEKRIYQVPPTPPEPTSGPTPRLQGVPARIQAILERKGQVILYGPPGTGKTYWAEHTAYQLAARSRFSAAFERLAQEQQPHLLATGNLSPANRRHTTLPPPSS